MAYKQKTTNENITYYLKGYDFFWNIRQRVGYGYQNEPDDVRLVQFLLNAASESFAMDHKLLVMDGLFGGKTWARIKWFQTVCLGGVVVDGMISPADGTRSTTPKKGRGYTIHFLNFEYVAIRAPYFADLRMDPQLPPELRTLFSVPGPRSQAAGG